MTVEENEKLVLKVFDAIERRDDKLFRDALHPEFEIVWPTSLPYGGDKGVTWSETWEPFQPTAAERKLDPRVVAANGNTVVVLWRQRGLAPQETALMERYSAFIKSATESCRARKCFTLTAQR
jgi:ketosteroid isomerase-like protein